MPKSRPRRALRSLLGLALFACGPSTPARQTATASQAAPSAEDTVPPASLARLLTSPAARRELVSGNPVECQSTPRCAQDVYRAAAASLRDEPGQAATVALLDALVRRAPDGELPYWLALAAAHDAAGDAGWLAAVLEVSLAIGALEGSANADSAWRTWALARGLPSPCPEVASRPDEELPAAVAEARGLCALACPDAAERLADARDPELVIVEACGPEHLGLTDAAAARFFAADAQTLLAIRGLARSVEAAARLGEGPSATGAEEEVSRLLRRFDEAREGAAISAHVPRVIPVDGASLSLPEAQGGMDGLAPLIVVLSSEEVYVGARPWIGADEAGALVSRGDAVPGPRTNLAPPALERALTQALGRAWLQPVFDVSEDTPAWLREEDAAPEPSGVETDAAPQPPDVEVDLVAAGEVPVRRVAEVLRALDAARPRDAQSRVRRPIVFVRVFVGDARKRVRVVPWVESEPARRHLRVSGPEGRREEVPVPSSATSGPSIIAPETRLSASPDLRFSRVLSALGADGAGSVVALDVGE